MSRTAIPIPKCPYCGFLPHDVRECSQVRAIEFYPDGTVKRVELGPRWQPAIAPPAVTVTPVPPSPYIRPPNT